jgi:hypothetical protein
MAKDSGSADRQTGEIGFNFRAILRVKSRATG